MHCGTNVHKTGVSISRDFCVKLFVKSFNDDPNVSQTVKEFFMGIHSHKARFYCQKHTNLTSKTHIRCTHVLTVISRFTGVNFKNKKGTLSSR